jgi:hypothetical protein
MTLSDLLSRATELAPEWCQKQGSLWFLGPSEFDYFTLDSDLNDEDRAKIVYVVLRECERRGLNHGYEYEASGPDKVYQYFFRIHGPSAESIEYASDPAVAALSAFVALLEAGQEVKA